jgi:hypothetical protein
LPNSLQGDNLVWGNTKDNQLGADCADLVTRKERVVNETQMAKPAQVVYLLRAAAWKGKSRLLHLLFENKVINLG